MINGSVELNPEKTYEQIEAYNQLLQLLQELLSK